MYMPVFIDIYSPVCFTTLYSPLNGTTARTKDGVPSGGVPAESEDVGVVCGHHGQRVRLPGEPRGPLDGAVEHHRLGQRQLGNAIVVAVVDSPS